jgi:hypothetical protein
MGIFPRAARAPQVGGSVAWVGIRDLGVNMLQPSGFIELEGQYVQQESLSEQDRIL